MTAQEAIKKATLKYPLKDKDSTLKREIYLQGLLDASIGKDDAFFENLAPKLRELWPKGDKDGKYSWREPAGVIAKRLKFIWQENNLQNKYSEEDVLQAARAYLARFSDDTKYMQLLKYFIFKQVHSTHKDGKMVYTYTSTLCNILENNEFINEENVITDEHTHETVKLFDQWRLV